MSLLKKFLDIKKQKEYKEPTIEELQLKIKELEEKLERRTLKLNQKEKELADTLEYIDKEFLNWYLEENKKETEKPQEAKSENEGLTINQLIEE